MTPSFTVRQGEYLAFMHRFTLRHGVAPSFDEIAAHFGTSPPSVNGMIKTLSSPPPAERRPGSRRAVTRRCGGDSRRCRPGRTDAQAGTDAPAWSRDLGPRHGSGGGCPEIARQGRSKPKGGGADRPARRRRGGALAARRTRHRRPPAGVGAALTASLGRTATQETGTSGFTRAMRINTSAAAEVR